MKFTLRIPKGFSSSTLKRSFSVFRDTLEGQGSGIKVGLLLALFAAGIELLRPWPIKILMDSVLLPHLSGERAETWGMSPEALILLACASSLLISASIGSLTVWSTLAAGRVGRKIATRIRRRVYEHLHRLALPFHQSSRSGDLLVRLMGDVNMVRDLLFAVWIVVLSRGALFLGTTILLFVVDPILALLALAPLPFIFVGIRFSGKKLTVATRKQRRKEGDVASFASETLHQIELVKAYAAEERTTRLFAKQVRGSEKADLKAKRIAAGMGRFSELMTGVGLALVLFFGCHRALQGKLSPGDLLVVLTYTRSLFKPLRKMAREGARLSKATACAERLLDVLDLKPEDDTVGSKAPAFRGDIEFDRVHFSYSNATPALQEISFRVPAGSLVTVVGPNGAGKSTLLSLLLRLHAPDSGVIKIDQQEIDSFQLSSYRERLAYVPQQLQLFGESVKENIRYGWPDASDQDVEQAARVALAHDFIQELPEGYETKLSEGGTTLSGGEARRLMLARAAVRGARILLLDEPLAGLDPEARDEVARAIRGIASGRTTFIVTHDSVEELGSDLVAWIRNGSLISVSSVEEGL